MCIKDLTFPQCYIQHEGAYHYSSASFCSHLFFKPPLLVAIFHLIVTTSSSPLPPQRRRLGVNSHPSLSRAGALSLFLAQFPTVLSARLSTSLHDVTLIPPPFPWIRAFCVHIYTQTHTYVWVCVISSVPTSGSPNLIPLRVIYSCKAHSTL